MQQVSIVLDAFFIIATLLTVFQFYRGLNKSKYFLGIIAVWGLTQLLIGSTNFYAGSTGMPPRFVLTILPPVLGIVLLFLTKSGRQFMDGADLKKLTILHTVRVAVEIVLYCLFLSKAVPEIMTFGGRNFDIVAGLTAPFVYYLVFVKAKPSGRLLLVWNILALLLLMNIVTIAILSLPTPFQQFGIDQPNIGILHFPYNWLPSIVVPLVLLSHSITIRQLINRRAPIPTYPR